MIVAMEEPDTISSEQAEDVVDHFWNWPGRERYIQPWPANCHRGARALKLQEEPKVRTRNVYKGFKPNLYQGNAKDTERKAFYATGRIAWMNSFPTVNWPSITIRI